MTSSAGETGTPEDANSPSAGSTTKPTHEGPRGAETGEHVDGVARAPRYAPPASEEFDTEGWVLVGIVVASFLVVPVVVLWLPQTHWLLGSVGFSLRQAYLIFPMIPAVLLGATAVWAAVRSRSTDD